MLVEALSGDGLFVVSADYVWKNRVRITQFFRSDQDGEIARQAVCAAIEAGESVVLPMTRGRVVLAEPILDREKSAAHGVWIRVARPTSPAISRPQARAFRWDLTTMTALRPMWHPGDEHGETWSVAEALQVVDLGAHASDSLSYLIADGADGDVYWTEATVRHDPDTHASDREVMIGVVVRREQERRVLLGLSFDRPPPHRRPAQKRRPLADSIAEATRAADEFRAVVRLDDLQIVSWFGPAPDDLAWRLSERKNDALVHRDDLPGLREAANAVLGTGGRRSTPSRCPFAHGCAHLPTPPRHDHFARSRPQNRIGHDQSGVRLTSCRPARAHRHCLIRGGKKLFTQHKT